METIIAYRGTDDASPLNPWSDFWTGWSVGGGFVPGEGILPGSQGQSAAKFYQEVVGNGDLYANDITLTGHSLGGGLAGLIASVYGRKAEIFDSMNFDLLAWVVEVARNLRVLWTPRQCQTRYAR